jgi:hypothetical protein
MAFGILAHDERLARVAVLRPPSVVTTAGDG